MNRPAEVNVAGLSKKSKNPRKRPRLAQFIPPSSANKKPSSKTLDAANVFELSDSTMLQKKIEFNLASTVDLTSEAEMPVETTGFGKIAPVSEPEKAKVEEVSTPCFMELDKYISDDELKENRMSKHGIYCFYSTLWWEGLIDFTDTPPGPDT